VSPSIGVKKQQQQRGRSFAKDNFTPRVVTFDLTPRRTRLLTWGARRFGMASSLSCQPSPLCQGRGCYARCAAWKVRRNIGVIEFSVAFLCSGRSAPVGDDAVCGACALLARSLPPSRSAGVCYSLHEEDVGNGGDTQPQAAADLWRTREVSQ